MLSQFGFIPKGITPTVWDSICGLRVPYPLPVRCGRDKVHGTTHTLHAHA